MATKVTIQNGQFQDAAGNFITGTLVLQLSQDALVSGTGTVVPGDPISIVVTSGNAAATPVWGTDNLTPSGLVYIARLFDTSGALVWGPENWSLTGSGPIELNTLTPSSASVSYPTAIVKSPSADQTISSNNLLPASGNSSQSLGSASAPWNAIFRDETASKLNSVLTVDGTRYANIQAALNDLPADGGMVVCPPGYRETITSAITLGSATSTVLLMLQQDVILTCNITGGTNPMFNVHSGSGIVGTGTGNLTSRAGSSVISLAATCSVTNVIQTADNPQACIVLAGFIIDNVNGGAVSGSFVELVNLNDFSIIRDVKGAYFPHKGMHISATTGGTKTVGPLNIQNCYFDGVNGTTARPLVIESDGVGAINGIHVLGGYWLNPGTSLACIEINGNGGSVGACRDIVISNAYTQSGTNATITGIKIADAAGVTVLGGEFQVTNSATGMTGIAISSSGSNLTHSIAVHNWRLNAGASNTGLNNSITTETLLGSTGNVPLYVYQGTGGTQTPSNLVVGKDSKLQVGGVSAKTSMLTVTAPSTVGVSIVNGADALFNALDLDSGSSATQYAIQRFLDRGTVEWEHGKTSTNQYFVQDVVNAKNRIQINQASAGATLDTWRVGGHLATALVAADFANSGWGTSPTLTVTRGTDMAGQLTMTAGTTPSANPTITLTFHDGTWTQVPVVIACRTDNAISPTTAYWAVTTVSATAVTFTFVGTPVAASVYGLAFHVIGT